MNAVQPVSRVVDAAGLPRGATEPEDWELLLRYAVGAPSGHNTQPWRFRVADDRLHLYADRSRALPVVDPDDRELVMSCGAALAHLVVALRHFGYAGDVTVLPDPADPDLLASLERGQAYAPRPDDHEMFTAIDRRRTHRAAFATRTVPDALLARLARETQQAGATLHLLTDDDNKREVATLVGQGDRTQFGDTGFRRELAAWIRPNRTRRPDGMPGYAFGIPDLPSVLGPAMIATVGAGGRQARKDEDLVLTAPALAVLSTAGDTPEHWLEAGQALAVLLLRATTHGLAASFLNQPLEVPRLRGRLRELLGGSEHPQLLLRIGYAAGDRPAARRTPRRPVADVLAVSPADTAAPS